MADEVWYDGIDQSCDGLSDFDPDGDGVDQDSDCDDNDATLYPNSEGLYENCALIVLLSCLYWVVNVRK